MTVRQGIGAQPVTCFSCFLSSYSFAMVTKAKAESFKKHEFYKEVDSFLNWTAAICHIELNKPPDAA